MHILAFLLLFQTPADPLFETVSKLDTELFGAYNTCNLEKFGSLLADDLEFHHDVTGLSTGKQSTVEAVKANICGKVHRDLAPGTLRVYPLNHYGAVETGIHFFCSAKLDKCPEGSGAGRFTTIWQNKDGEWKATRIISYDHCNGCSTMKGPEFRK